jgi:intracellular multiplication protein IcmW
MADLSLEMAHTYWADYIEPSVYRVVSFMESVEDWTLDGDPQLEEAMVKLGEALENIGYIELQQEDKIIAVAAYLKATRKLLLMQTLDTAYPGAASKLLMQAENSSKSPNDAPGLFLKRNVIFERLRLLSRVFSPERLEMVLKILEESIHE